MSDVDATHDDDQLEPITRQADDDGPDPWAAWDDIGGEG
jgi:hypothetical protein